MNPSVGFLVTCLVDFFRPTVGFAALKLLEDAGCEVVVPPRWTCCGQPAYNSGASEDARRVARAIVTEADAFTYLVVPSASCAGMIRHHYPDLFAGTDLEAAARSVADKTYELCSFLVDVLGHRPGADVEGTVTYHDSCSALREMGVHDQPRRLLGSLAGLTLREAPGRDVCCGFGGTFCVKYPRISDQMVTARCDAFAATGAETLLGGDLGCLLNLAGKLRRNRAAISVRHIAEVLAGMVDGPGIAGDER